MTWSSGVDIAGYLVILFGSRRFSRNFVDVVVSKTCTMADLALEFVGSLEDCESRYISAAPSIHTRQCACNLFRACSSVLSIAAFGTPYVESWLSADG